MPINAVQVRIVVMGLEVVKGRKSLPHIPNVDLPIGSSASEIVLLALVELDALHLVVGGPHSLHSDRALFDVHVP